MSTTMPMPTTTGPQMGGLMWMPTQPPTFARIIAWHPQPIPVFPLLGLALLVAYLVGVLVLRRRGDRWPISRILWWVAGVFTIEAMTATAIDGYGMELFSVHMVQHMVIGMLTPILLCLGAPMTLLLRALPARSRKGAGRRTRPGQATRGRRWPAPTAPAVKPSRAHAGRR